MKSTVVVNGVTLTREQVEQALKDLNKPEPIPPPNVKPGDRIRSSIGNRYLVLDLKEVESILRVVERRPNPVLLLDLKLVGQPITYSDQDWCKAQERLP